jgi:hypothetical protein
MAYKKASEVRMDYYDRLLRSVMEMLEGTVKVMKVDGMPEAAKDLGRALIAIEDAWGALALGRASSLVASEEREPDVNRRNDGAVVPLRRCDEVQITGNDDPN